MLASSAGCMRTQFGQQALKVIHQQRQSVAVAPALVHQRLSHLSVGQTQLRAKRLDLCADVKTSMNYRVLETLVSTFFTKLKKYC